MNKLVHLWGSSFATKRKPLQKKPRSTRRHAIGSLKGKMHVFVAQVLENLVVELEKRIN